MSLLTLTLDGTIKLTYNINSKISLYKLHLMALPDNVFSIINENYIDGILTMKMGEEIESSSPLNETNVNIDQHTIDIFDYDSDNGCYYSERDNETATLFLKRVGYRETSKKRKRICGFIVLAIFMVIILCFLSIILGVFIAPHIYKGL